MTSVIGKENGRLSGRGVKWTSGRDFKWLHLCVKYPS